MAINSKGINGKKTILLADDDAYFRFAIATELRTSGYLVVCAENGERAIRMIEDCDDPGKTYDLVITDLVMPKKDGLRFGRELRNINRGIPLLIITGFLSPEVEGELREDGIVDFLEKPFTPEELKRKVEEILLRGEGAAG